MQYAPRLLSELRGIIDLRREAGERSGQFLLLGSASLDLIQKASETLARRMVYVEMTPIGVEDAEAAKIGLNLLWLRGGFPDSLTAADDEESYLWRQAFIRSYLERDVPMFAPRMPATTIGRLWAMLANGQGTLLNRARLVVALMDLPLGMIRPPLPPARQSGRYDPVLGQAQSEGEVQNCPM